MSVIANEGKKYSLEKLTDTEFEELSYGILKNSNTLKKQINYDDAFYIEGGTDCGKDAILIRDGKTIGISQSKHSEKISNMSLTIVRNEIIKVLLYFKVGIIMKIEGNKIPYLFFISSKLSENDFNILKKFETEIMGKDEFKKQVKRVIKKYSKINQEIDLNNYDYLYKNLHQELKLIFKKLNMIFYTGNDIQNFLVEKDVEKIIPRYFEIKKVIENRKLEIPEIESEEIENYKNNLENLLFKEKLDEIKLKDYFIEDAMRDLSYKNLAIISLIKFGHSKLKKEIKNFENEVLKSEKISRELLLIDLSEKLEENKPFKKLKESKKYYLKFIKNIPNEFKEIRYLDYIPPSFSRGTVHDLVNDKKIESWIINIKDIQEEEI